MKFFLKSTLVIVSLAWALGLPGIVSAGPLGGIREERREVQEERKNLIEQLKDRVGTKAGELKNIFGNGKAAIGSGTLTAKTDTTLTVEKDGKSYTVNIDDKTQLRRRFWGKAELSEFSVGNTINVIGRWTDDTHTAINAVLVRNISIQKRFGVFFGDVKSLVTGGWVMSTQSENRRDQTVTVSSSTKFINRMGDTITQADVKVGHKVRVRGLWDRSLNTVTEVTQVKDFSLPVKSTVTPTP